MIQFLSVGTKRIISSYGIEFNYISSPNSLDSYLVNIIDLTSDDLWKNTGYNATSVNCISDLDNLSIMIQKSNKTKFVVLFPQNTRFIYRYDYTHKYTKSAYIKNCLSAVKNIVGYCFRMQGIDLVYELNKTNISDVTINSDFYFDLADSLNTEPITYSSSEKLTSFKIDNCLYSTLNFDSNFEKIFDLLSLSGFIDMKSKEPEWFRNVERLNDKKLFNHRERLLQSRNEIDAQITLNAKLLEQNNEYKSILYSNGSQLVSTIFKIIKEIAAIDLTEFNDIMNEDFNFIFEGVHYVGEIKGVNENVKNKHLAQLNDHVEGYKDSNDIAESNVKGLLIINPFRKNAPQDKDEIHINQINKAKNMYGFLIIRTEDILSLLEKSIEGVYDKSKIINIFKEQTGLISVD